MDGLGIRVLAQEWNAWFAGARIDKVHQPTARELVLAVRAPGRSERILLSADRQAPRAHGLRGGRPANPTDPPMFCMLVRRRIEGGRIVSVQQPGWERVLQIHVESLDDIGEPAHFALVLEMMGKHSNLIFCAADPLGTPLRVLDAVVHVTADMSRVRQVIPGVPYQAPPPQDKVTVSALTVGEVADLLAGRSERSVLRSFLARVHGVGPELIRETAARVGWDAAPEVWLAQLRELFNPAAAGHSTPTVGVNELGYVVAAAPFPLTFTPRAETASSFDAAVEQLYADAVRRLQNSSAYRELDQAIAAQLDRLRGKRAKLEQEQVDEREIESLRMQGDLLMAFLHQVQKGRRSVTLPNFYDGDRPCTIALDPALSPTENATRYYKRASKRKRALPVVAAELERTADDIRYLESVLATLEQGDPSLYPAIRKELERQGFIRPKVQAQGRRKGVTAEKRNGRGKDDIGRPDEYRSSDGWRIRVGRNNLQNDRLTLRQSRPDDLWFHVKDAPGSHVVVEVPSTPVPETTLAEAALLAAYFSKLRTEANVPVDYTAVRHVWKPNGARPGHVLYEGQRTVYATPDKALMDGLLARRVTP
ncbi:MAG: NFACT family protein [Alicyclobacillus sp.]|nr:NFACT family protein [Alicyclobacillus sp.]